MDIPYRIEEGHADAWALAMRVPPGVMRGHVQVEELGGLLLVARGEGDWWAVTDRCRQCHEQLGSLAEPSNEVAALLRCPACGCPHGPDVVGCSYVPSLAVDDEVYVLVR